MAVTAKFDSKRMVKRLALRLVDGLIEVRRRGVGNETFRLQGRGAGLPAPLLRGTRSGVTCHALFSRRRRLFAAVSDTAR
jgi:hypothetical protein